MWLFYNDQQYAYLYFIFVVNLDLCGDLLSLLISVTTKVVYFDTGDIVCFLFSTNSQRWLL